MIAWSAPLSYAIFMVKRDIAAAGKKWNCGIILMIFLKQIELKSSCAFDYCVSKPDLSKKCQNQPCPPWNGYLHWAHAVFTVVKEIDQLFRICNNLNLIGHSVFVIDIYFYPGPSGGLAAGVQLPPRVYHVYRVYRVYIPGVFRGISWVSCIQDTWGPEQYWNTHGVTNICTSHMAHDTRL